MEEMESRDRTEDLNGWIDGPPPPPPPPKTTPPLPPPDAATAAADGAIFVWLTILIVLGANLPLGYRIIRRNSMREISGSFSPLAPEFFSPSRD